MLQSRSCASSEGGLGAEARGLESVKEAGEEVEEADGMEVDSDGGEEEDEEGVVPSGRTPPGVVISDSYQEGHSEDQGNGGGEASGLL